MPILRRESRRDNQRDLTTGRLLPQLSEAFLRPYQREAVDVLTGCLDDNDHVHVLSLPTGAGKTLTAIAVLVEFLRRHLRGCVLWVAPRGMLLDQAREKLRGVCPELHRQSVRLGSREAGLASSPRVYFSTLASWDSRRRSGRLPRHLCRGPLLVIVDESHWAMSASLGHALRQHHGGWASMVGLSATPNARRGDGYRIAYRKSYMDLCPEYLARPKVRCVRTGVEWRPDLRHNQVAPESLAELGGHDGRNNLIVDECLQGLAAGHYTRVIIFACDVQHATALCRRLSMRGVASRAVHSRRPNAENEQAIRDFRTGGISVLVTVEMLAVGLDVPEIDAVFLARPTASLILLAQMIGRGARKAVGKVEFWIVEFTDNIRRLGNQVLRAADYVSPGGRRVKNGRSESSFPDRHREPHGAPQFEHLELPGLAGLSFVRGQTFGIEIELTSPGVPPHYGERRWMKVGRKIVERLRDSASAPVHPRPVGYHDYCGMDRWYVSSDASAGWEIVSPILRNAEGFEELVAVCRGLDALVDESPELHVNYRCGMHLTLATRLNTRRRMRGFAGLLTRLEPGLFTLVAPSRLYWFDGADYRRPLRNVYCRPLRESFRRGDVVTPRELSRVIRRELSVNLTRVHEPIQTLEVRMHNGTTDYRKIVPWVCLWMRTFNHARYEWRGAPEFGRIFRSGNRRVTQPHADREDIFRLLADEGIILDRPFADLLRARRAALKETWSRVLPRRVEGWERAGWYGPADG